MRVRAWNLDGEEDLVVLGRLAGTEKKTDSRRAPVHGRQDHDPAELERRERQRAARVRRQERRAARARKTAPAAARLGR